MCYLTVFSGIFFIFRNVVSSGPRELKSKNGWVCIDICYTGLHIGFHPYVIDCHADF